MSAQRGMIVDALQEWAAQGRAAVLATVVATSESAPRGIGAQLAVAGEDHFTGGLTGGCAEVGVLLAASELLAGDDATAARTMTIGPDGCEVGPLCESTLEILVERVDSALTEALRTVREIERSGEPAAVERRYERVSDGWKRVSARAGQSESGAPGLRLDVSDTDLRVSEVVAVAPRIVIGGAGDVATELVRLARQLGWRTAVVDPRSTFLERTVAYAAPDQVIAEWPTTGLEGLGIGDDDAVIALAHDDKIDIPVLERGLTSDAFYVGAIGSRRAQQRRREALTPLVGEDALARLRGPAGLDLGGSEAPEIALSIAGEMVAARYSRAGSPLSEGAGPIRAAVPGTA